MMYDTFGRKGIFVINCHILKTLKATNFVSWAEGILSGVKFGANGPNRAKGEASFDVWGTMANGIRWTIDSTLPIRPVTLVDKVCSSSMTLDVFYTVQRVLIFEPTDCFCAITPDDEPSFSWLSIHEPN